jgi:hypothetical protein
MCLAVKMAANTEAYAIYRKASENYPKMLLLKPMWASDDLDVFN